jgi:RNA polymerase sigma factor (sigma-70 family)
MDADAVATYDKYSDELTRFASALVGPFTAHDISANVLVRVLSNSAWTQIAELRPYLFRSVLNEAHSQRRSADRRLRREVEAARQAHVPTTGFVRLEVLDAIRKLTVRQRGVIYLTYWLDRTVEDVATELGLSRRTVERELTAARSTLEVLLK